MKTLNKSKTSLIDNIRGCPSRIFLLLTLIVSSIGFCTNLSAQIIINIGDGITANTASDGPTPYGTLNKSFRQQYLILASEIEAEGGGQGVIHSMAFNVSSVNNASAMHNFTIRIKHTNQTSLTTTFENGDYQTVFEEEDYMPGAGWNDHSFTNPFFWNGNSNIIIEVFTSLILGDNTQNVSVFNTSSGFNSCLRFQSNVMEALNSVTGTISQSRANIRLYMQHGTVAVTIGQGGSTGRMPVNMLYKNSLFETIYLASEINTTGLLTAIKFYNSFYNSIPAKPTNIWIGETTQMDLSGGWIPSTQLTQVFSGTVTYPVGANEITISLSDPFPYHGGNLVMMVQRPMDTRYYGLNDVFITQSGALEARTLMVSADITTFDPANPPADTAESMYPKTTFMFINTGLGTLNGTVFEGTTPVSGATVTVNNTNRTCTTSASGTYSFTLVHEGIQSVSATRYGYTVASHNVNIVENQVVTQDFSVTPLGSVTISGHIVASNNPNVGISGAIIQLSGYGSYSAVTDDSGNFSIRRVYCSQTYNYTVSYGGLADAIGQIEVGTTNLNIGDIIVPEITFPPVDVVATEDPDNSLVNISWTPTASAWLHYDSGINTGSIGTGGETDFDVAIRFTPSELTEYEGSSLQAIKVWPVCDGNYSLRVWVGGNSTTPGQMIVDQPFSPTLLNAYNTIMLNNPVYISGSEELWFGYRCNVTSGYPAGCDNGPLHNGFGNLIFWQGAWTTLSAINPDIASNWNIQGYVGYSSPRQITLLNHQPDDEYRISTGALRVVPVYADSSSPDTMPINIDRSRTGYKVWRLLAENPNNESTWTLLTPDTLTDSSYSDDTWTSLPSGVYKYAVKAVYTNDVLSSPALSNDLHKGMMGTLAGTVTDSITNLPIGGALVSIGVYHTTTNDQGAFSIPVYQGFYTVIATKIGYQVYTQSEVSITGLQTTTVNILMTEKAFPPISVTANEAGDQSNTTINWSAPDPNSDPIEDFESGSLAFFPWVTGGSVPWEITTDEPHTGTYCAVSGGISHNQNSTIQITRNVTMAGTISFWLKVSSEYRYDFLRFSIDGAILGSWSGTVPWTQAAYPISVGEHTIMWEYYKDSVGDSGSDCVWLDDITFPVSANPEASVSHMVTAASQASQFMRKSAAYKLKSPAENNRAVIGYKVYRLVATEQANEDNWNLLTQESITQTSFIDNSWSPLPPGVYKYAVKAIYTNDIISSPGFSNEIHKSMMGTLSGSVTEADTNLPIEGALVTAGSYSGISNAQGEYSFPIYAGTYNAVCAKNGYQTNTLTGLVITEQQTTIQSFELSQVILPPYAVNANAQDQDMVNVAWTAPGIGGGEWFHYDSGQNNDSIGTGGAEEADVAIRIPVQNLSDYIGMSLQAVKVWPASAGTFSIRVWVGGDATSAGQLVVDQPFTPTPLNSYNTVVLNIPVYISGTEELWIGYHLSTTSGYPAGCDAGPQTEGLGNLIFTGGAWTTLTALNALLTFNWNIQGYLGFSTPTTVDNSAELLTKGLNHPAKSISHDTNNNSRGLMGYHVWRLIQGQESSESEWIELTANSITDTDFQDTDWGTIPDGWYRWAVKAVYSGGATSQAVFSNVIRKQTQLGSVAGIVRNLANQTISGATVTIGEDSTTTNANGAYGIQVSAGTYSVTATAPGYDAATQTGIVVETGQITTVNFQLPDSVILFEDGFESYDNFVIEFSPWTLNDVDQSPTYGILNYSWTNSNIAQSYIIFNPSATIPALPAAAEPHTGSKYAACFAAVMPAQGGNGPNNDWMITPLLAGGGEISFWARSYVSTYGLERFKIGVSTTGTNPDNFSIISGTNYVQASTIWTQYTYDLTAYAGQQVRIGINCVSSDAYFFMVDDVQVTRITSGEDDLAPVATTKLFNNYPNPFNPETTIRFSIRDASPVTLEVYNVKGQRIRTLVNETKVSGNHEVTWNGKDDNGRNVSSGIYYYKMTAGNYNTTKKMILIK